MKYTFERNKRLTSPAEFQQVYAMRYTVSCEGIKIFFKTQEKGLARLGMAIAKRQVPRAVDRMRIKRRIRENFRLSQYKLFGVDVIVTVYQGVEELSFDEFNRKLNLLWQKMSDFLKKSSSV